LSELATTARKRRKRIREIITKINGSSDQHSNSVHPLPGAVEKLSNPIFEHKLPFPFIGIVPKRFKVDKKTGIWPYEGRIKFRKLLEELTIVRGSLSESIVWLYGTQGYGKSHLLAVLVCYLAAQDERVVYIPDCREWLQNPVEYIKKAMLFAWADDTTTQEKIETLVTETKIDTFFERQKNVLVVSDQLNALTGSDCSSEEMNERASLRKWLMRLTSDHTAVFSSSANYREFIRQADLQSPHRFVRVYGGLKRVSHHKIMSQ
jgi:NACHT domain